MVSPADSTLLAVDVTIDPAGCGVMLLAPEAPILPSGPDGSPILERSLLTDPWLSCNPIGISKET